MTTAAAQPWPSSTPAWLHASDTEEAHSAQAASIPWGLHGSNGVQLQRKTEMCKKKKKKERTILCRAIKQGIEPNSEHAHEREDQTWM